MVSHVTSRQFVQSLVRTVVGSCFWHCTKPSLINLHCSHKLYHAHLSFLCQSKCVALVRPDQSVYWCSGIKVFCLIAVFRFWLYDCFLRVRIIALLPMVWLAKLNFCFAGHVRVVLVNACSTYNSFPAMRIDEGGNAVWKANENKRNSGGLWTYLHRTSYLIFNAWAAPALLSLHAIMFIV